MKNKLSEGREWKKLGEVAEIIMGQSPPSDTYNEKKEGLPFFQGKAEFGTRFPEVRKYCSKPVRIAEENDILMSVRAPVGSLNITDKKCCIGRGLCAIRPSNQINYLFLYHFLKSIEREISEKGEGSTFTAINRRTIELLEIPVPPLSIQQKIVSILERAENLKQKRELANEEANKIIQSIFYKMFGDGKCPNEEISNHIEETISRDPTKKTEEVFRYVDIAGIDNQTGQIKEAKEIVGKDAPSRARKVIKENDVIVSTVRPNLNATALIPKILDNQIASTGFCVIRCKKTLNPKYLFTITRQKRFIDSLVSKMKGASYPAVTNNDVLKFKIPLPPISLQNQFASLVKKIDSVKQKQNQATAEINTLFDALMQKAFNGGLIT